MSHLNLGTNTKQLKASDDKAITCTIMPKGNALDHEIEIVEAEDGSHGIRSGGDVDVVSNANVNNCTVDENDSKAATNSLENKDSCEDPDGDDEFRRDLEEATKTSKCCLLKKFISSKFKNLCVRNRFCYCLFYVLIYGLLFKRVLVFYDMYTDVVVALELYKSKNIYWFALSCIFIISPFLLVWMASLRYLDIFLDKISKNNDHEDSNCTNNTVQNNSASIVSKNPNTNKKTWKQKIVPVITCLYLIPFVGMFCIAGVEMYLIICDAFLALKLTKDGKLLILDANKHGELESLKEYRKCVEILSESIPQIVLQIYIFMCIQFSNNNNGDFDIQITSLTQSLVVGIFNFLWNFYQFNETANKNGLHLHEYMVKVLQLSTISVKKFVPRLPAIKKGKLSKVNWSNVKLEDESLAPIIDGITSNQSQLKEITVSLKSLKRDQNSAHPLSTKTCSLLGQTLKNNDIKLRILETTDIQQLQNVFFQIDLNHKGYFTLDELIDKISLINTSYTGIEAKNEIKKEIFDALAIRNTDRVYLYDFLNAVLSFDKRDYHVNMFEIIHPIDYVLDQIIHICHSLLTVDNNVNNNKFNQILEKNEKKLSIYKNLMFLAFETQKLNYRPFIEQSQILLKIAKCRNEIYSLALDTDVENINECKGPGSKLHSIAVQMHQIVNNLTRILSHDPIFKDLGKRLFRPSNDNNDSQPEPDHNLVTMLAYISVHFKYGLYVIMDMLNIYFNKNYNVPIDYETEKLDVICIKLFLHRFGNVIRGYCSFSYFVGILYLLEDNHGKTCMDYAIEYRAQSVADYFISKDCARDMIWENGASIYLYKNNLCDLVHAIQEQTRKNFDNYFQNFGVNKRDPARMKQKFTKELQNSTIFKMVELADIIQQPNFSVKDASQELRRWKEQWQVKINYSYISFWDDKDLKLVVIKTFVSWIDDLTNKVFMSVDDGVLPPTSVSKIVSEIFDYTPRWYKRDWISNKRFHKKFIDLFNILPDSDKHDNKYLEKILYNVIVYSSSKCIADLPDCMQYHIAHNLHVDNIRTHVFGKIEDITNGKLLLRELKSKYLSWY